MVAELGFVEEVEAGLVGVEALVELVDLRVRLVVEELHEHVAERLHALHQNQLHFLGLVEDVWVLVVEREVLLALLYEVVRFLPRPFGHDIIIVGKLTRFAINYCHLQQTLVRKVYAVVFHLSSFGIITH